MYSIPNLKEFYAHLAYNLEQFIIVIKYYIRIL